MVISRADFFETEQLNQTFHFPGDLILFSLFFLDNVPMWKMEYWDTKIELNLFKDGMELVKAYIILYNDGVLTNEGSDFEKVK